MGTALQNSAAEEHTIHNVRIAPQGDPGTAESKTQLAEGARSGVPQ